MFRPLAITAAAAALALFFTPVSDAIGPITSLVMPHTASALGNLGFISLAQAQPGALTQAQSDALNAYNHALTQFKSVLSERRAQVNAKQALPNLPGQALYLARNNMISTY